MFFSKRGRPTNWSLVGQAEGDLKKEEGREIKKG